DLIDLVALDLVDAIRPDSENATWFQDPIHFREKTIQIKPMHRLGNGDQIDALIAQPVLFGRGNAKIDIINFRRGVDLFLAGVGGNYFREALRETDGRLSVPSGAIPHCRARGDK